MIRALLKPELLSLWNQLRRAPENERTKYLLFLGGGLLFWVGLFVFFRYTLGVFLGVELFGQYLVKKLMSILLLALFSMLCFSNLISALSSYYLSDDLSLVHSLPLSAREIHVSRFVLTFLNSSWMMVVFGLPVFLAYGVVYKASALYYLALLAYLVPFLMVPTAIGTILATLLVNLFPARRTKELMVAISMVFIVGLFVLLRVVQPERLVNADSFADVMTFLSQLQAPTSAHFPPHWGSEALMPLLSGEPGRPGFYLLLNGLTGAAGIVISGWLNLLLYPGGWTKAQQSIGGSERRAGFVSALLEWGTAPLPPTMRALILKDIKTFFRDSAEWPQLLMILALVGVYLYSIKVLPLDGPFITLRIHNIASFLNLAMVGFVVSSISVRFLFTSVSVEGRAFWMLRAAPLDPMQLLLAKYVAGVPLLLGLGLFLVIASNLLLGVSGALMAMGCVTMVGLCLSLAGLSVGIGAQYPNFKAENVAKIAAGPGGILFMIVAQLYVAGVLLVLAWPVTLVVRAEFRQRSLMAWELGVVVAFSLLAFILNVAATLIPLRRGARALRELE